MKKTPTLKLLGSRLPATLDRLRKRHGICGASLAVLKDGEVSVAAVGWANAATRIEATPDTLFQVGSISKPFTATLALQLVDDGLLDLDAPVREYLPEFVTADPVSATVTARQLLAHTSGLDGDFFPPNDPHASTAADYVRQLQDLPQLFAPGTSMAYCNAGYVVLARLVEVLRGAHWNALVMSRICEPLGMTQTFAQPTESLRFRAAMGHGPRSKGSWPLSPMTYLPLSMAGAGSVLSMTASDLLRFGNAHLRGPRVRAGRRSLLSQASFRAMQSPQVAMPPYSRAGFSHLGLSWFLHPDSRFPAVNHDGTTSQFAALHLLPKQGSAYALLINSPGALMMDEVRRTIYSELGGVPAELRRAVPAPIAFESRRYVGIYAGLMQTMTVTAAPRGQLAVVLQVKGAPSDTRLTLRPIEPDVFAVREKPHVDQGARVVFLGDVQGQAEYFRLGVRMTRRIA